MCSNLIPQCSADLDLYCTALTYGNFPSGRTSPASDIVVSLYPRKRSPFRRVNLPELKCTPFIALSLSLLSFLPPVLETAKCGYSASRWDWWACATQTSRRSTNVSLTLALVPNAPPRWGTISQRTNRPDYHHPIKAFTQANGGNDAFLGQRLQTGLLCQRHYLCARIVPHLCFILVSNGEEVFGFFFPSNRGFYCEILSVRYSRLNGFYCCAITP